MRTDVFDFHLPEQLIAQQPLPDRDSSRLLHLSRATRTWIDRGVRDLPELLRAGDLLVCNDTRVIPARLRAQRDSSGGKIELLLLPPQAGDHDDAASTQTVRRVLMKSGGKLKPGESFTLRDGPKVVLLERHGEAGERVAFQCAPADFERYVLTRGEVPLPPYIQRAPGPSSDEDRQRYQTVFARSPGAVAAPTAGLHFTAALLERLRERGVGVEYLTLHVGPGTFRPVKADEVEQHFVDPEPYFIPAQTIRAIVQAKAAGRRVVAVGTTSLRALEGGLAPRWPLAEDAGDLAGETNLFCHPPFAFTIVDALITNFHLPRSSLLMLLSAFAAPGSTDGVAFIRAAYEHAVAQGYRFYSYGDACLVD